MRIQMRLARRLSGFAIAVMMAGSAGAAPISVGVEAFSDPVITFTGLTNGTPITTQYSADGATFSGGLYALAGSGANFDGAAPGTSITIDFSQTMLRAGFDVATQAADDLMVDVSAYSGDTLVSTGTLNFVTPGTATTFVGIEDVDLGIDRLVLTAFPVAGGSTQRFLIDNIRFDAAAAVVPEPSAALLFPLGMLVASYGIRRRRHSA